MNEAGAIGQDTFVGADTSLVETHIQAVFVDAWRKAVSVFPKHYFTIKDFSGGTIIENIGQGTGYIELPADFYLLVSFKMDGWHTATNVLYSISDSIAAVQSNEFTRGNPIRPVCVQNEQVIGGKVKTVLEYYSLPRGRGQKVEQALYIPLIKPIELETEIDVSDKLFVPLAYLCASAVYLIYEKGEISKALEEKVLGMVAN